MPAISVILAVHNTRRYAAEAVRSVLGQTFGDFELILIDDGSTDGSADLLRPFADADRRVRLISRENKGLTKSLNEGLSLASASLIARMDADDVCLPERFAKQVAYLADHPDVVCVGSRIERIDPYGSPLDRPEHPLDHDTIDAQLLRGIGWSIVHPAAMMRTEALRRVGGYREQFRTSQDLDLWLRLAEIGRLANLPEVLLRYRQHFESVATTKADEQWRVKRQIVADAYERRGSAVPDDESGFGFSRRTPPPRSKQLEQWVWAALRVGNLSVARRHAVAALKESPLHLSTWRAMACALRGR